MEDNLQKLYENIKGSYDLPTYDVFKSDMTDPVKSKKLHDTLIGDNYDIPDYDTFTGDLGIKKKVHPLDLASQGQSVFQEFGQPLNEPSTQPSQSPTQTPKKDTGSYLGDVFERMGAGALDWVTSGGKQVSFARKILNIPKAILKKELGILGVEDDTAEKISGAVPFLKPPMIDEALTLSEDIWNKIEKSDEFKNIKGKEQELRESSARYDQGIEQLISQKDYKKAIGASFLAASESLPLTLTAMFGGGIGLATIGSYSSAVQYDQLKPNTDMNEAQKIANALVNGGLEIATERLGSANYGKLIKSLYKTVGKEQAEQVVKAGLKNWFKPMFKRFGIYTAPLGEGMEELVNQLGGNITARVTDEDPDRPLTFNLVDASFSGIAGGTQITVMGVFAKTINSFKPTKEDNVKPKPKAKEGEPVKEKAVTEMDYSLKGKEITREDAEQIINEAKDINNLDGLKFREDKALESRVRDKFNIQIGEQKKNEVEPSTDKGTVTTEVGALEVPKEVADQKAQEDLAKGGAQTDVTQTQEKQGAVDESVSQIKQENATEQEEVNLERIKNIIKNKKTFNNYSVIDNKENIYEVAKAYDELGENRPDWVNNMIEGRELLMKDETYETQESYGKAIELYHGGIDNILKGERNDLWNNIMDDNPLDAKEHFQKEILKDRIKTPTGEEVRPQSHFPEGFTPDIKIRTIKNNGIKQDRVEVKNEKDEVVSSFDLKTKAVDGEVYWEGGLLQTHEDYRGNGIGQNAVKFAMENLPEEYKGLYFPAETIHNDKQIPYIFEQLGSIYDVTKNGKGDVLIKPKAKVEEVTPPKAEEVPSEGEESKPLAGDMKSILNQETDLLGDDKWASMLTSTQFIESKAGGMGKPMAKLKETLGDGLDVILKPILKQHYKYIKDAIDNGDYITAIQEGRMTANDAKSIIESAGIEVPKDILNLVTQNASQSQELPLQENTIENKPKDKTLPPGEGNIPPTGDNGLNQAESKGKPSEKEKSLLNRLHNAENLSDEFKKGVEEKGLTYEQISNAQTAEDVDYLIGKNGLNKSETAIFNTTNSIEPRIRALTATRLIKTLDELADGAENTKEEFVYRNRSIAIADFIDTTARDWGRGIQILGSAEVNALLSPKSQVIRIKRVVRGQRDKQIENNRDDIDKKKKELTDANAKSVDDVINSKEYTDLKARVDELEKKLKEEPKIPKPPKDKPTSKYQAKIKKEQEYRKTQWDIFKKGTKTTSASAIGLSTEQIEALGNIVGSYVREGITRTEDILSKLKKEYFKNTGKILSDDDARKVLPEKVDGKLLTDIEAEGEAIKAAETLATRIERMLKDPTVPKNDPVKQMVNTLFEKVQEKDTKKKAPVQKKTDLDKIRESLVEREQYADVWEKAKEEVLLKIETNEELSEEQKSEYNKRLADFYGEIIGKPFSEKQVSGAVKKGLTELGVSLDQIVKDHYTVYDATKRTLQEKLVKELGFDGKNARLLSEAVGKQFDKIAISRKKSILKQGVTAKESVHPKTAKQLHDKLIELTNMGAFSDAEFTEAYADKWGFPKLEDTQIKEIERLAKLVQDAPEGYQKFERIQDLLAYTENIKGIDMGDVYMSMWYSSILSGYRTQSKNFVQNNITSLFLLNEAIIHHPLYAPRLGQGLLSGWGEGIRQFGHIMATGYNPIKGYKIEVPSTQERFAFKGGDYNPANWGKYVTRLMVAADAFSYSGLKEMRSYEMAMNMARQLNKDATEPTKGTWAKATELLNKTSEKVAIAEQTAKSEGLEGVEYKRRVWELMEQGRSKELVEDAAHFAARGTFNYSPEGVLGMVTESISHLTQNAAIKVKVPFSEKSLTVRPGKFIVPFTRIIANVTNMALDYYPPIGLSRAAMGGIGAKGFEVSDLTKKFYRKYTPEERQKVLIKAMVGVAAQVGFFLLTQPDDNDESAIEITTNGYGDFQKNYELKETGWQPYSMKIGGKWFSYQYTPLVLALAPLGYYRDMQKYHKEKFDEEKVIQNVGISYFKGLQVINDMTWASSLNTLMSAFNAKEPGQAQAYLKNLTTSTAKGFVYPKLAEQITQVVDVLQKNPRRDASDLIGKIMRDMPIARNNYNVMLNAIGEPVLYDPIQMISNEKSDPFWEYIISKNANIGKPNAKDVFYDDVTKTQRAMTNQEYYDFVLKTGKEIKQRILDEVVPSKLDDEEIVKEISNIKTEVRNKFRTELFGWGELRSNYPEDWKIMKDNDALQVSKSTLEVTVNEAKVRIGKEKGIPSKDLEMFNNKTMEYYRKEIIPYLKSNREILDADKRDIDEKTGKSYYEKELEKAWSQATNDAKSDMIDLLEAEKEKKSVK